MRRLVMAAVFAVAAQGALAADLPDDFPALRGGITDGFVRTSVNWQGAYVGGQGGFSSGKMDFTQATSSLAATLSQNSAVQGQVSDWTLLGKGAPTGGTFGAFVGYNAQWDDVVLGVEANYSHFSNMAAFSSSTVGPLGIIPNNVSAPPGHSYVYNVSMTGAASAQVTDVMTFRGRAAYAIDNFLPYVFAGAAVGRVNISRSLTINDRVDDYITTVTIVPGTPPTTITTSTYNGSFNVPVASAADTGTSYAYGYTAGFGLEAMLWGGFFARGEYEYIKFTNIKDIGITLNTVRAGLGYKF